MSEQKPFPTKALTLLDCSAKLIEAVSARYALHLNVSALVIWLPFTKDTFDVLQTDNVDSGQRTADSGQRTVESGHGAHMETRRALLSPQRDVVSVASLSDSWQPVDHRIVPCRAVLCAMHFLRAPGTLLPVETVCELHKYLAAKGKN